MRGGRVARAAGIQDDHSAASPGQHERRAETGRATADDLPAIAAIQAAKKTPELIPLAHPVAITRAAVEFTLQKETNSLRVRATVECNGETGVEREALTAAAVVDDVAPGSSDNPLTGSIRASRRSWVRL